MRKRAIGTSIVVVASVLALLLVIVGCDSTALRVLVVADLAVPDEVDALVVTVRGGGEETSASYALEESAESLRESLTLLPGARMNEAVLVEVAAKKGERLAAVGEAEAAFRDGAVEELIITLDDVETSSPGEDAGVPDEDAGPEPTPDAGPKACLDDDGDGYGDGADCLGLDCDEENPDVHEGADELCNGIDDDCDFGVDEGCDCTLAENHSCGKIEGECRIGWQVCTSGQWSECENATLPAPEVCNGEDDDCDGDVDEGCP